MLGHFNTNQNQNKPAGIASAVRRQHFQDLSRIIFVFSILENNFHQWNCQATLKLNQKTRDLSYL